MTRTVKGRPVISFVITQKERKVLEHIQETLGFGSIYYNPGGDFHQYIVGSFLDIYILTCLLNGNLVITHRVRQITK